jgi:hypothetical protein
MWDFSQSALFFGLSAAKAGAAAPAARPRATTNETKVFMAFLLAVMPAGVDRQQSGGG